MFRLTLNKLFFTALEDSRLREKELREELAQTEDARQSTFDKYVELKQKYAGPALKQYVYISNYYMY